MQDVPRACTGTRATSSCSTRRPPSCPSTSRRPSTTCRRCCAESPHSGRIVLTEEESKRFITTYGFPVVAADVSRTTSDEALAAAEADRLPGGAQDRLARHHPQERGRRRRGRRLLGRRTSSTRTSGCMKRVTKSSPNAAIEGVSVQKMVRDVDYELILGMKKDRQFGSVIVFGAGGVACRGPRGLLGEPAAAQPDARPPHDGGDAHLPVDARSRPAASSRPTSANSRSCSRCCRTSSSTSPRSPRSTSTRSSIAEGRAVRGRCAHRHRRVRARGQAEAPAPRRSRPTRRAT